MALNLSGKTIVVDLDGTLCTNTEGDYTQAEPIREAVETINACFLAGAQIIIFTARGTTTNIDWEPLTKVQLACWGVSYHELILGKPFGHYYIDDKGVEASSLTDGSFIESLEAQHRLLP